MCLELFILEFFTHNLCRILPPGAPLRLPEPSKCPTIATTWTEARLSARWKIGDSTRLTVAAATPNGYPSFLRLIYGGRFLAGRSALPGFV